MVKRGCMLLIAAAAFCLSACASMSGGREQAETEAQVSTETAETEADEDEYEDTPVNTFIEDISLTGEQGAMLIKAMSGDTYAMKDIYEYLNDNYYFGGYLAGEPENTPGTLCHRIGELYYNGDEANGLEPDKKKAYRWYCLSVNLGNFYGTLHAGDMAREGDGIPASGSDAFAFYQKALNLRTSKRDEGYVYDRLALCYLNGIGTEKNFEKAREYCITGMLTGNADAYYQYLKLSDFSQEEKNLLSKAVSCLDFSKNYFEMVYGGLDAYSVSDEKGEVVETLAKIWDAGDDETVKRMKGNLKKNKNFPESFVDTLMKVSYSYSYHAFAERYGVKPNRGYEDAKKLKFSPPGHGENDMEAYWQGEAERYLSYKSCEYYEMDFDSDGEDEIGIPLHTGAGGAFQGDGFRIYKRNGDGLYQEYAQGPDCTLRDAMRIIEYEGHIYFITNPFSDEDDSENHITVKMIDSAGKAHTMWVDGSDYQARQVLSYDFPERRQPASDDEDFQELILGQTEKAITAAKEREMYHFLEMTDVQTEGVRFRGEFESGTDVYCSADPDNDGTEEIMRKCHAVSQSKYYDEYYVFQIYENEKEALADEGVMDALLEDAFYGIHSGGNIYELLPLKGVAVQFWLCEWKGQTYCLVLTKKGMIYTVQTYLWKGETAEPVYAGIFLDEPQKMLLNFDGG